MRSVRVEMIASTKSFVLFITVVLPSISWSVSCFAPIPPCEWVEGSCESVREQTVRYNWVRRETRRRAVTAGWGLPA